MYKDAVWLREEEIVLRSSFFVLRSSFLVSVGVGFGYAISIYSIFKSSTL